MAGRSDLYDDYVSRNHFLISYIMQDGNYFGISKGVLDCDYYIIKGI